MTRILYITPAGERGGAEVVLRTILAHLDRRRFEPLVVCLQDGPFVAELKAQSGADVEVIQAQRFRNAARAAGVIRCLGQLMDARRVDIVHSNGTGAHLYGSLAARLRGIPSVYHIHDVLNWSWSRQGLLHLLAVMSPATASIAVSDYVAGRCRQSWPWVRNLQVIRNAVDVASLEAASGSVDVREEWGWAANAPLVVWCGRLQRWKGTHVFVEAAARARQRVPGARFLIVGGTLAGLDAGYEKDLRALAARLDLDGHLGFTGYQADVGRFLDAADLLVHSSIQPEPFGLVILEAMALGKPVIVSGDGGPRELVEDGVTGVLVPAGDPDALARAMIGCLQDGTRREAMGRAARTRATTSFAPAQMMSRLEALYHHLAPGAVPASEHVVSA